MINGMIKCGESDTACTYVKEGKTRPANLLVKKIVVKLTLEKPKDTSSQGLMTTVAIL